MRESTETALGNGLTAGVLILVGPLALAAVATGHGRPCRAVRHEVVRQVDNDTAGSHGPIGPLAAAPEQAPGQAAVGRVPRDILPGFRTPRHGGVYVVAHRGAHQGIPENSLPAYQRAIDLGADFVEIDVRTTKDGALVSVHNETIDAYVEGASGKVKDLTLAQLRALDIGLRIGPQWQGTRIPTVEEIAALCCGKIGIYLDLKDGSIPDLVAIVRRHGMERDVIWYASVAELQQLNRHCPRCIAMPDPGPERNLPMVLKQLHPRVVASFCDRISPSFIKMCHDAGAIVIADETRPPDCWQQALAWGTDGIQTDQPRELIEYLTRRAAKSQ